MGDIVVITDAQTRVAGNAPTRQAVVEALKELTAAEGEETLSEHACFAEKLELHVQMEHDILYPAAILVGEYLKLKMER